MRNRVLKWLCKKRAFDSQNQGGAGNSQPPVVVFQLVSLDSTADFGQLPRVMLAHNLMTSSSGTSSNDGRRTDGDNGRRTDQSDGRRTDQNAESQGSQNGQQTTESLIRQILSNSNSVNPQEFQHNGSTYRRCPMHKRVTLNLNNTDLNNTTNDFSISLIDQGCNGGFWVKMPEFC